MLREIFTYYKPLQRKIRELQLNFYKRKERKRSRSLDLRIIQNHGKKLGLKRNKLQMIKHNR